MSLFIVGIVAVFILSMGISYFIFMRQKGKEKVVGKVHEIYIYPIKSCAGIKVRCATVTPSGLACGEHCSDRAWAIVRRVLLIHRKKPLKIK